MDMEMIYSTDLSDKHSKMDISAELSVTLVCVPLEITGSAKYFKETRKFAETQSADYYVKWISG